MKKIFSILTLILLCNGCIAYFTSNHISEIVPWRIEHYIDLDEGQSPFLKRRIDFHLKWHRRDQLPEYIALIDKTITLLDQLNPEKPNYPPPKASEIFLEINALVEDSKRLSQNLTSQIAPDLATLFLTANNMQLLDIYKRFEEQNQKYSEQLTDLTVTDYKERARDHLQSQLRRWIGRLSSEQKHLLDVWESSYIPTNEEVLIYRRRWQLRFRDLMSLYKSQDLNISNDLTKLFAFPQEGWHPIHSEHTAKNSDLTVRLFSNLATSLSSRQRKRTIKKLTKLKKMLAKSLR